MPISLDRLSGIWGCVVASAPNKPHTGPVVAIVVTGLVLGVLNVSMAVAFGALIFSGELATFLSVGIGLTLFGAVVVGGLVAAFSSYPGTIATPQDIPSTVLAIVAAALYAKLSPDLSREAVLATIVAAVAVTSLLSGICYLLLGQFRLGSLVRFLPYPDLYFIEAGHMTVVLEHGDGERLRLQSLRKGTVVGEIGLYLDDSRTASVVADCDSTVFRLSKAALERMKSENPEAAATFHEAVARMLASRLAQMNRMVQQLL